MLGTDLQPLFETILNYIPAPEADRSQPFQMLVSSIDYNEFVGRIAIGRIERGTIQQNQEIAVCNYHDPDAAAAEGQGGQPCTSSTAWPGSPVDRGHRRRTSSPCPASATSPSATPSAPPTRVEALPFVKISAPTIEMTFSVNDSPFAGREGKFVTSRQPAGPAVPGDR